MEHPKGCGPCRVVSVVEKSGGASAALRRIFRFCGRENCRVQPEGEEVPPDGRAVLLICGDGGRLDPGQWAVCVAERELSDRAAGARRLITYSLGRDDADFTAHNIRTTPDGHVAFEIVGIGVIGRVRLRGGLSCVGDALAAAAAAVGAGVPFADVLTALNGDSPEPESFSRRV